MLGLAPQKFHDKYRRPEEKGTNAQGQVKLKEKLVIKGIFIIIKSII